MNTGVLKNLVIVGRDAEGWLTALAMQQRFARKDQGINVTYVELPSQLSMSDIYITPPTHRGLHQFLRAEERPLLNSSDGIQSYGQRYANWCGSAPAYMHAYDRHGVNFGDVDFIQYWVKATKSGLNVALEDFSFGAVAAKNNRIVIFNDKTASFSQATFGYSLHALSYVKSIAKAALAMGVRHIPGNIKYVEHEGTNIGAVTLQDDIVVTGDFFIDASGVSSMLIKKIEPSENYCSWRRFFPCDTRFTASAPALNPIPSFSHNSAFKEGWFGIHPLMSKSIISGVFDSSDIELRAAVEKVSSIAGTILSDVNITPTCYGFRRDPWIGNCCAIGSAAAEFEQLDAVDLYIFHVGLTYFCELIPIASTYDEERALYNEKIGSHAVGVRDFQLAHYHLNGRTGERLWDVSRRAEVPDTLARKIALFKSVGKVSLSDHELFQEDNWTSILIGQGLIPDRYNPLVDKISQVEQIEQFQKMLKFIAAEVNELPLLQTELELNTASAEGSFF